VAETWANGVTILAATTNAHGFCSTRSFGFPQQQFGFVPGPMPPPWAFNGAYQQFPPNPAYGLQSNQWLASHFSNNHNNNKCSNNNNNIK
jgi:hypothetical protein